MLRIRLPILTAVKTNTAYWVIDLASYQEPTAAQIVSGQRGGSTTALKSGSEVVSFINNVGTGSITEQTLVTGLTSGVQYRLSWTIYDSGTAAYPTPVHLLFYTASAISTASPSGWVQIENNIDSNTAIPTGWHQFNKPLAAPVSEGDFFLLF